MKKIDLQSNLYSSNLGSYNYQEILQKTENKFEKQLDEDKHLKTSIRKKKTKKITLKDIQESKKSKAFGDQLIPRYQNSQKQKFEVHRLFSEK
jgi:uncharacterized NAD(P)/FAD-binding protein YdhS